MISDHTNVWLLRPGVSGFGELPTWLDDTSARPGAEQFGERWRPIEQTFRLEGSGLHADGHAYALLGAVRLPRELVMIFEDGLVAIMANGSRDFAVAQVDFAVSWLELPDNSNAGEAITTKAAGHRPHHRQHHSFQPEVYFNHDWHPSGNRFSRWDDAKAFIDNLARSWIPAGFIKRTVIRRVNEPPNARWNRIAKQAERFDDTDTGVRDYDGRAA